MILSNYTCGEVYDKEIPKSKLIYVDVLVLLLCDNAVYYCVTLKLNVFNYGFRVNDVNLFKFFKRNISTSILVFIFGVRTAISCR